jgi:ABC-type glycerol-3-phosphate transport system permease component
MDPEVVGPANGFIETYLAQCNYLGVEVTHSFVIIVLVILIISIYLFIIIYIFVIVVQPNNQLVQFICDLWAKHITELNLTLCPGTICHKRTRPCSAGPADACRVWFRIRAQVGGELPLGAHHRRPDAQYLFQVDHDRGRRAQGGTQR